MKTRIIALFAGLLAVLPMTSAWAGGGSSTTYYATLKVAVSSGSPTGAGTVYASKDSTASSGNASVTVSGTSKSLKAYGFAKTNGGFQFDGWSNNQDGSGTLTTGTKYTYSVSSSETSSPGLTKTVYAVFSKIVLPEFAVTCQQSPEGKYTVNGGDPCVLTQNEAVTVTLATDDPNFFCWKIGNKSFTDNPHVQTFSSATTISAQFLTSDAIAEVSTQEGLKAALANDKYLKVIVPAGLSFTIGKGDALTVPAGKALVLDGTLVVLGIFTNNGMLSGSGKVYRISKKITQGEIVTPENGAGGKYTGWKYRNTTVETVSPSLTGVDGFGSVVWGVLYNGDKVAQMSQQSPKAIMVSIGTDSINTISSIADNADRNEVATSDHFVLFADCNLTGPILEKSSSDKRLNFTGWIDCAGYKITHSVGRTNSSFHSRILNGTVSFTPGTDYQNATATFVNCGSITVKNIKGTACPMHFYDCGTEAKPTSLTFGYNSSPGTRKNYFYSGYYSYSFTTGKDDGNTEVRGGSFTTDPTSWLQNVTDANGEDASLKVVGPQNGLYKVVAKPRTKDLAEANGKVYQSLQAAVDEIAANAPTTLKLKENVVLEEPLVVSAGKCMTIDLDGHDISGGSIANSGALRVEDNSNQSEKGVLSAPVINNGNGTIDLTYGQYAGTFTLNGGTLTTHGGTFTDTFSYEEKGGVAKLRGGTFRCAISVPEGFELVGGTLGEKVKGVIICDKPLSAADVSYTVRGLDPVDRGLGVSDFDLYSNNKHGKSGWLTRGDFAGRDALWDRLAELKCTVEPVESKAFEATMSFDRPVRAGSVTGVASVAGQTKTLPLEDDIAAGEDYHVFIPMVTRAGYTAISYKNMFNGEENDRWAKLLCGLKNGSLDNLGTTLTFKYQLRTQTRAADYQSTNPKYDYTFTTYASATYRFTGKGAIANGQDHSSLSAALVASGYGGTIRLTRDCTETIVVDKVCAFTIDANGFVLPDGAITAGAGLELDVNNGVYTVSKPAVVVRSDDGESEIAAVPETEKVAEEAEKRAKENGTTAEEETQRILQETNEETGLKVWQEVVLESAGVAVDANTKVVEVAKPAAQDATENTITLKTDADVTANANAKSTVQGVCLAKVEVAQDGEKTLKTVDTTVQKRKETTVNLAELESGVYRPTLIVNDAAGNPQAIPDTKTGEIVVMKTETKQDEPVVIVAVGNESVGGAEVKIDILIDSSTLAKGDNLRFWNQEKSEYEAWTYGADGKWVANGMNTDLGTSESRSASEVSVPAGAALWFTRSSDSEKAGQSVAVVAKQPEKLETRIKASDNGKSNNWNLIANPNPNHSFALSEINVDEISPNDQIVITQEDGDARTYTCDASGHWGYSEVKVSEVTIGGRKRQVKSVTRKTDDATISAGQGVWYISTDKKAPVFNWEGKGAK